MTRLFAVLLVLMLATPPIAQARSRAVPPQVACSMGSNTAHLAVCIEGHHMSKKTRDCLVYGGITAGGVAIGGLIGGAAARAIAGGILGAGAASCLSAILRSS